MVEKQRYIPKGQEKLDEWIKKNIDELRLRKVLKICVDQSYPENNIYFSTSSKQPIENDNWLPIVDNMKLMGYGCVIIIFQDSTMYL